MKKKTNAFVFTRPLQYANIKNIVCNKLNDKNILFVYPNFSNGKEFYESILKYEKEWDKVIFIKSKFQLILECLSSKIHNLYLSTDLGFYTIVQLFSKNSYHYEEGWGTYSKGEKKNLSIKNKISVSIYQLLGSGAHIGGSYSTKGVVVYNEDLHKFIFPNYKKNIYRFPSDFKQNISANLPFFEKVFGFREAMSKYKNKSILIYATGWQIDEKILSELETIKNSFDYVFIKLHPHIRKSVIDTSNFILLEQNVLLEIYISELLSSSNNITIWHDNTSSIFYFLDDIKVRNIGRQRPGFDLVFEFFTNKK